MSSMKPPPPYSQTAPVTSYTTSNVPPYNPHVQPGPSQNPQTNVQIGFQPSAPSVQYVQPAGSSVVYAQTVQQQQHVVLVGNTCPACRAGVLSQQFTACGIVMAILFFPIGILCCMVMTERRCNTCGSSFG